MNILDIIAKKRDKGSLTKPEIEYFIDNYVSGEITDYQASALLMAMYINGLDKRETTDLTLAMAYSANVLDFKGVFNHDYILDKHSTGGVGDKVTIIAIPIAAALGVKVFKMSGRGLGFTGGTADKLESIDGYITEQELVNSMRIINSCGACMVSQSENLAVADKKLYALRDVTATVPSIPLIAASVMSKKIASGVDKIVLEVTVGDGAFMQTLEQAELLAKTMVGIGEGVGKEVVAIITNMNQPLGRKVGNSLEIEEAIEFLLSGKDILDSNKWEDLREVVYEIVAYMMKLADKGPSIRENKRRIEEAILDKSAYNKFLDIVKAQGGEIENDKPIMSRKAKFMKEIKAEKTGFVNYAKTDKLGEALVALGGGRYKKEDKIDPSVGFVIKKKNGDRVEMGETILQVFFNDDYKFNKATEYITQAVRIVDEKPELKPHILEIITHDEL